MEEILEIKIRKLRKERNRRRRDEDDREKTAPGKEERLEDNPKNIRKKEKRDSKTSES